VVVALSVLFVSCSAGLPRVKVTIKGVEFTIEVARTPQEQERGLMYRKTVGPREGMIFVYDRDQHLAFWMKNTSVTLSIAFLSSDGRILQIEDMTPFSLDTIRSRLSCRYALELAKGAFDDVGAVPGDMVVLPTDLSK
jgi:uncharacterized membrane protein (UPF0127 family)